MRDLGLFPPSLLAAVLVLCVFSHSPMVLGAQTLTVPDLLGGYRIQNRQPYGVELSLLASVVLGGSAFPRAIRSRKPVPILLSVLSAFGLFTFGNAFRKTL